MVEASVLTRTEVAEAEKVRRVYPFSTWNADIFEFMHKASEEVEDNYFRKPSRTEFKVATIRLPVASERWSVNWAEHPTVTFEDLRVGRLPKLTQEELRKRQEAIRLAKEIRTKLDIRPLTTPTIVRQLREGIGEE